MELSFLGGASEVGRSSILLKDHKNILLDCGLKINGKIENPLDPGRVDAFILSHAHLDHCGFAPSLYYEDLPATFGTLPTIKLSQLLIEDSVRISKKEHIKPKFYHRQMLDFFEKYLPYDYNKQIDFDEYAITLHDAGHISGSAITKIYKNSTDKRLVYTGDFKLAPQETQKSAEIVESEILIIESTYAKKKHSDRNELQKRFINDIKETLDNNGTALIPCFAVGRAQEILSILYKNSLIEHTYLDGMAKDATNIVAKYPDSVSNKADFINAVNEVNFVGSAKEKKDAVRSSGIILTTAGMLNGGPVLNYITKINRNSLILLTGFQQEGTNGKRLLEGKPLLIDNKKYSVKVPTGFYDFSAHADSTDIYEYVRKSNPETVICVHGDADNTKSLAASLKIEGFEAYAPNLGEKIKLEF